MYNYYNGKDMNTLPAVLQPFANVTYAGSVERGKSRGPAPLVDRKINTLQLMVNGECLAFEIPSNTPLISKFKSPSPVSPCLLKEVERKNAIMSLFWPHIQQHVMELRLSSKKIYRSSQASEQQLKHSDMGCLVHLAAGTCPEKAKAIEMYVRALGYDVECIGDCRSFFKRNVVFHADEQSAIFHPKNPSNDPTVWDWSCFMAKKLHSKCCQSCCSACRCAGYGDCSSNPYDAICDTMMRIDKPLLNFYEPANYVSGEKNYTKPYKRTIYGDSSKERVSIGWSSTIFDIFPTWKGGNNTAFNPLQQRTNDIVTDRREGAPTMIKHQEILLKVASNMMYLEQKSQTARGGFFTDNHRHNVGTTHLNVLKIALDVWCWGFHTIAKSSSSSEGFPPAAVLYEKPQGGLVNSEDFRMHFGIVTCQNATQLGILTKVSQPKFIKSLYEHGAESRKAAKLLSHPSHMVRFFSAQVIKETFSATSAIVSRKLGLDERNFSEALCSRWSEVCKIIKQTCAIKITLLVDLVSENDSSWSKYAKNGKYDVEQMLKWLSKTSNLVINENLLGAILISMESHGDNKEKDCNQQP